MNPPSAGPTPRDARRLLRRTPAAAADDPGSEKSLPDTLRSFPSSTNFRRRPSPRPPPGFEDAAPTDDAVDTPTLTSAPPRIGAGGCDAAPTGDGVMKSPEPEGNREETADAEGTARERARPRAFRGHSRPPRRLIPARRSIGLHRKAGGGGGGGAVAGARNAAAGVAIGAGVDSAAVAFAPVATRPRPGVPSRPSRRTPPRSPPPQPPRVRRSARGAGRARPVAPSS